MRYALGTASAFVRSFRTALRAARHSAHEQCILNKKPDASFTRQAVWKQQYRSAWSPSNTAAGTSQQAHMHGHGARWATSAGVRASCALRYKSPLDVSMRTKSAWKYGREHRHERHRFRAGGSRHYPLYNDTWCNRIRFHLMEAWATTSKRRNHNSCHSHRHAPDAPNVGGNGGGKARLQYNFFLTERKSFRLRQALLEAKRNYQAKRLARHLRIINQACQSEGVHADGKPAGHASVHETGTVHRHSSSSPTRSPRLGITRAPLMSMPVMPTWQLCGESRGRPLYMSRTFSTSRSSSGIHLLPKLLKSADSLSYINLLFRFSVSFIPIAIRRAAIARRQRLTEFAAGIASSPSTKSFIVKFVLRSALFLPFILLAAVLLSGLESTPITGRLRLLLLSDKEERDIVDKVLQVGATVGPSVIPADAPMMSITQEGPRDWLAIMRAVLGEEDAAPGTLLGGRVLHDSDWRVQLVNKVLDELEEGVPYLSSYDQPAFSELSPTPIRLPLGSHGRSEHLKNHNAVLVIERPESNAFSFGFYGCVDRREPGVVIVFTGAIDEIMRAGFGSSIADERSLEIAGVYPVDSRNTSDKTNDRQNAPWLKSIFGSLVPAVSSTNASSSVTEGSVIVNQEQEEALAVLLAHELAHLVLSHTIESYASTALLWPQLEKLGWDGASEGFIETLADLFHSVVRVLIYPITAFFGPFVQDAIGATVKVGLEESSGLLPALTSSCESRKMETEADLVALRLLANAGIDPRSALQFWEERMAGFENANATLDADHDSSSPEFMRAHSKHPHSFIRSHPADEERIRAIRSELERWARPS